MSDLRLRLRGTWPATTQTVVVYSMGDTLWPRSRRIAEWLGVPYEKLSSFWVENNLDLTTAQQREFRRIAEDPELFERIEFYAGVADLLLPEKLGAKVLIHTNCTNAAIARTKRRQLLEAIPGLCDDHILTPIISVAGSRRKELPPQTYIMVESNPYVISTSRAELNLVMRKPWNQTHYAQDLMHINQEVVQFEDGRLDKINQYVARLVAERNEWREYCGCDTM